MHHSKNVYVHDDFIKFLVDVYVLSDYFFMETKEKK